MKKKRPIRRRPRTSKAHALLAMQLEVAGFPKPQWEYRFHPTRLWRADLAWPEKMILVEIDGATFSGGRHVRGIGHEKDSEKRNAAMELGYRVFTFNTKMVNDGRAFAQMQRVLLVEETRRSA